MEWQPNRQGRLGGPIVITALEGEQVPCTLCRGTGMLPSRKAQCPACRGRGFLKVTLPAVICAYCKGRGEVPARSNITCTVCGGKGMVGIDQPVEVCPQCRGTGATPTSRLPCLVCRGTGVVTTREREEATIKMKRHDWSALSVRLRQTRAAEEIKTVEGHDARPGIPVEAEPSPISLQRLPLSLQGYRAEKEGWTSVVRQPQRRRETRSVSSASVGGLVRRLMATERARILGRKATDLGRYALEKRTQRWKESRKRLKPPTGDA